MPTPLHRQMTQVLLELSLLSNGATAKMDGNTGGGSVRYYGSDLIPSLGQHDAPQYYWRERWERCADDAERENTVALAEAERDAIRRSDTDVAAGAVGETLVELQERIVARAYLGFTRKDVAIAFNTSELLVARAWREAGLDELTGQPVGDATGLTADDRRALVAQKSADGATARQVAFALGLSYSTVLRDLGQKA